MERTVGNLAPFQPHKLIIPALASVDVCPEDLHSTVTALFGPLDARSDPIPFTFTRYYDQELGPPIRRVFFSARELVDPALLPQLKEEANARERETARPDGRRTINLDPGLLSLSRVILATTKASGHRIPLRDGIHAEVTLLFRHGAYEPLEWTYPDFRGVAYREWLLSVREIYHGQLRAIDPDRNWRL